MELSHNRMKYFYGGFFLLSGMLISLEIFISASFNQSIVILTGINIFIFLNAYFIIKVKDFPTYLLILNIVPLIYLNNEFHYYLKWIVVQDLFIFAILYISLLKLSHLNEETIKPSVTIRNSLLIMVGYFMLSAIHGLFRGNNKFVIIDEFYHFCYYLLPLVIVYVIQKREYYLELMKVILLIILAISLEYVYIYISNQSRFVTFQSNLFLILVSISLSFILFLKKYRLLWIALLIMGTASLIISETRSLWISAFFSLVIIFFSYLRETHKKLLARIILYGLILIIPALLFSARNFTQLNNQQTDHEIKSRAYSVLKPTEDVSFAMRIELGYYAFNKFLHSPVYGTGLGDYVKYKIFNPSSAKQFYIDNTWLFVLWKGGIIGLFLFAWVFWVILRDAWFVYKNTREPIIKSLSLAIWASIIGFILSSFFAATLIKYKYGVVIAIMIAFIEFEKSRIEVSAQKGINI